MVERAPRVKLGGSILALIILESKREVRTAVHQLSVNGGLLKMEKPLDEQIKVTLVFHIGTTTIRARAKMLFPMWATNGWLQPFQFIELAEPDKQKLDTELGTFFPKPAPPRAAMAAAVAATPAPLSPVQLNHVPVPAASAAPIPGDHSDFSDAIASAAFAAPAQAEDKPGSATPDFTRLALPEAASAQLQCAATPEQPATRFSAPESEIPPAAADEIASLATQVAAPEDSLPEPASSSVDPAVSFARPLPDAAAHDSSSSD
jgi:hypothetical protein